MKKISLILAALFVLLLASCGKAAPKEPDTTQAPTNPTVAAQEAGFTLEDVLRENAVSTLVSAYGGVQAMRYENDALYTETYYFMYAGKQVSTCCTTEPDAEKTYSCIVDGTAYEKAGDHLQFSYALEAEEDAEGVAYDDAICAQLLDGTIQRIEEADADTWRFELRDTEQSEDVVCRCNVTKQTLTIKQIEWEYGDGSSTRIELEHGHDVMVMEFGMLDGFARDPRTVKCVCTMHDKKGKPSEKTFTAEVPYNAEPLWVASRALNFYMDKDLTVPYEYPGNGEGYTVYATDAMG